MTQPNQGAAANPAIVHPPQCRYGGGALRLQSSALAGRVSRGCGIGSLGQVQVRI